jgi:hypothetical protein
MYYLVLIKENTVSIIRNYKARPQFMAVLFAYLKQNDIKYIENVDDITFNGKYCLPTGLKTFQIIEATVGEDGYVFKGERCLRPVSELHVVYYKYSSKNDKYSINKQIKNLNDL